MERKNKARFPEDVKNHTQYGMRVKSIVLYLSNYQLLPYERISELMGDLFQCPISEGSIDSILEEGYRSLEEFEQKGKEMIKGSEVCGF